MRKAKKEVASKTARELKRDGEVMLTARVPARLAGRLRRLAAERGITRTQAVVDAVLVWCDAPPGEVRR